eukprot:scaffold7870_cov100-Isochrysis_galbana.AAC.2
MRLARFVPRVAAAQRSPPEAATLSLRLTGRMSQPRPWRFPPRTETRLAYPHTAVHTAGQTRHPALSSARRVACHTPPQRHTRQPSGHTEHVGQRTACEGEVRRAGCGVPSTGLMQRLGWPSRIVRPLARRSMS